MTTTPDTTEAVAAEEPAAAELAVPEAVLRGRVALYYPPGTDGSGLLVFRAVTVGQRCEHCSSPLPADAEPDRAIPVPAFIAAGIVDLLSGKDPAAILADLTGGQSPLGFLTQMIGGS